MKGYMHCKLCGKEFQGPYEAQAHMCVHQVTGPPVTATVPLGPSLSFPQFVKQERSVATSTRLEELRSYRAHMIAHVDWCRRMEDWHGVSDAANDLREADVEIRCLEAG